MLMDSGTADRRMDGWADGWKDRRAMGGRMGGLVTRWMHGGIGGWADG
jgi:hypothetical protein